MSEVISITRVKVEGKVQFLLKYINGDHRVLHVPEVVRMARRAISKWCLTRPNKTFEHLGILIWGLCSDFANKN